MCVKRSVENTAAASVDATTAPRRKRFQPSEAEQPFRGDTREERAHDNAQGAQEPRRHLHLAQPAPRGLEAAFVEDQPSPTPGLPGQMRVVEVDAAGPVRAEQHPEPEEGNEDGQPRARRAKRERHAEPKDEADDEKGEAFVHAAILATAADRLWSPV